MKINIFRNKKILVAGGTGMVGQQLVPKLLKLNAQLLANHLNLLISIYMMTIPI